MGLRLPRTVSHLDLGISLPGNAEPTVEAGTSANAEPVVIAGTSANAEPVVIAGTSGVAGKAK